MTEPNRASTQSRSQPPAASGGIKETLESILVAFVLAFIFRAFVVEAFVIPTGSMAPTLLGAHVRFACEDCGYGFDVSFDSAGEDMRIPKNASQRYEVYCPNCGLPIAAKNPAVRYGDRILVLKYLYLFQDPKRWDVVVFKAPFNPSVYDYSQNYIKRLIGLPGEVIMILDGDIYVGKKPGGVNAEEFDPATLRPEDFTIQTKSGEVQDALWRIVYDNDHYPRGLLAGRWTQPWQPNGGTGWTTGDSPINGRAFSFNNPGGAGALEFKANLGGGRAIRPLTDWLAYDQASNQQPEYRPGDNVSDLKLSLVYERQQGEGPLRLKLTKRDDVFVAEITSGQAQLLHGKTGEALQPLLGPVALPAGRSSLQIDFTNVDYQVALRVNGQVLLQTTPKEYGPDVAGLLRDYPRRSPPPTVGIEAANQVARISHLSLWRDVFYLNRKADGRDDSASTFWGSPEVRIYLHRQGEKLREGEHGDGPEALHTAENEYFVLGDNSLISGDARYWNEPIRLPHEALDYVESGRVPERFLLGKAFFVYWPAGYPVFEGSPNIIPNFGEMRFIH